MSQHNLDDLLRAIEPDKFSPTAHGAGHRVVLSKRRGEPTKSELYRGGLVGWFLGGFQQHVFVKRWSVPKDVKDWRFNWSEGTSAISLDFDAKFVIQANEDLHAVKLAEALMGGSEPAGEVLYGLIAAQLHRELDNMLRRCNSQAVNLLDEFKRSTTGVGASEVLDQTVTRAVADKLGGAQFRIGFQLKNIPPMQVEVRSDDTFMLADARDEHKVETTALLQLVNYQAFKKSGLETEAAVRDNIAKSITQAVKQRLFAKKYYDVVTSFFQGPKSIVSDMEQSIREGALTIGYEVNMFQSFPDIAALELLQPKRIEIGASEEKYALYKSLGYVQVGIVLSVTVAKDFSKLHLLIDPNAPDAVAPISKRVRQICRDALQRFDHKDFNLEFESKIVPELKLAIVKGLASYGLEAEIISVRDEPTEDASRFRALRGRTVEFQAEISPQADLGDGDPVPIAGVIEVVGLAEQGWAQFEGKDFGYREDSQWSKIRLEQLVAQRGKTAPTDANRRSLAIELELAEIRERVVRTLEGAMARGPELAKHWRDWNSSKEIEAWAKELARSAVANEFGLAVELRAFRRQNTLTEDTLRVQRGARHELLRQTAMDSARNEIEHQRGLGLIMDKNQLQRLEQHGQAERQALMDESDPQHEAAREKAARETERLEKARRSVGAGAESLLPPAVHKRPPPASSHLPWQHKPSDSGDGQGSPPPSGE